VGKSVGKRGIRTRERSGGLKAWASWEACGREGGQVLRGSLKEPCAVGQRVDKGPVDRRRGLELHPVSSKERSLFKGRSERRKDARN